MCVCVWVDQAVDSVTNFALDILNWVFIYTIKCFANFDLPTIELFIY